MLAEESITNLKQISKIYCTKLCVGAALPVEVSKISKSEPCVWYMLWFKNNQCWWQFSVCCLIGSDTSSILLLLSSHCDIWADTENIKTEQAMKELHSALQENPILQRYCTCMKNTAQSVIKTYWRHYKCEDPKHRCWTCCHFQVKWQVFKITKS